jgi:hypothetical protein
MATKSVKTVRIRNISQDISTTRFTERCAQLITAKEKKSKLPWKAASASSSQSAVPTTLKTSLAAQNDNKIATVTFETEDIKAKALNGSPVDWLLDDAFNGITTIYSPLPPHAAEIEYATSYLSLILQD